MPKKEFLRSLENHMDLVEQCPERILSEECSPAWPYAGFLAILGEQDAVDAIEDQIVKLGTDFDRSLLAAFYRLLWLLNDTIRHKTFQGYVGFRNQTPGVCGFFSEILLCPFDYKSRQLMIGLDDVQALSAEFKKRLAAATMSVADEPGYNIRLTPVRTKFGAPPEPFYWGYALSLRAEVFGDSIRGAVGKWAGLVCLMNNAFEKPA